jgi:hypothetical protein
MRDISVCRGNFSVYERPGAMAAAMYGRRIPSPFQGCASRCFAARILWCLVTLPPLPDLYVAIMWSYHHVGPFHRGVSPMNIPYIYGNIL